MFFTLKLDEVNTALVVIDQTLLPGEEKYISLTTPEEAYEAIKKLRVRGAPAIGLAAAIALFVHMKRLGSSAVSNEDFGAELYRVKAYLNSARPTAVNLSWALTRMANVFEKNKSLHTDEIIDALRGEALAMVAEDTSVCKRIGGYGAELLKPGFGILTHCNAGALAASRYGTALAPIYIARENGMSGLRVYADETRPLLQGARLTAFELSKAGVDVTLICDNMASSVMSKGLVDIVFVGCDRVAANGDTANKIGTSGVAILAKEYGIPFYVCAPFSTIDTATPSGGDIVIEERDAYELTSLWYEKPMAPNGVNAYNPAFDVTPSRYITGFITERGIMRPPFLSV
jgi:methylthioribose-1-phosphate isomerase